MGKSVDGEIISRPRPSYVVVLGSNMYNSDFAEGENIRASSRYVVNQFRESIGNIRKGSIDRVYRLRMLESATQVAQSKRSRKQEKESRLVSLRQEMDRATKDVMEHASWYETGTTLVHFALFGGAGASVGTVGAIIAESIFPELQKIGTEKLDWSAAAAATLGGLILGGWRRHKRHDQKILERGSLYQESAKSAEDSYRVNMAEEYARAITDVEGAWKECFGSDPPKRENFKELMVAMDVLKPDKE